MDDDLPELTAQMEAAAARLDFEEARALRDKINLIRGGADPQAARVADTEGLARQQPGAMGLGTSRQRVTPPPDWKPPPKPDLKTKGRGRRS
ncbi:UvrB/UvrC motif-containing protein [Sphingomonas sp. 1P06PA]|uniref:UvrB/UvrC motif-containing protein n=1 Tax=Sphingomonas sp. 1P06PA TaxID=554121 RepID=UPI0039A6CF39